MALNHSITYNAELQEFEKDVFVIVKSVKFRSVSDNFQKKLKSDKLRIKKSNNTFIFADKAKNIYHMHPKDHQKLIKNSITKTYKKMPRKLEKSMNLDAKNICKKYL